MFENTQVAAAEVAENAAMIEQQRILNGMLARSATDGEFRALMLADARAAFAQAGVELPEGMQIQFIENHCDATIVLPNAIDEMVELSEAELTQLNGGSGAASAAASGAVSAVTEQSVALTVISSMACAGAAVSIGAVALTIYLANRKTA
jgi:hypothetical protein